MMRHILIALGIWRLVPTPVSVEYTLACLEVSARAGDVAAESRLARLTHNRVIGRRQRRLARQALERLQPKQG
jgi:hypothetical protein